MWPLRAKLNIHEHLHLYFSLCQRNFPEEWNKPIWWRTVDLRDKPVRGRQILTWAAQEADSRRNGGGHRAARERVEADPHVTAGETAWRQQDGQSSLLRPSLREVTFTGSRLERRRQSQPDTSTFNHKKLSLNKKIRIISVNPEAGLR